MRRRRLAYQISPEILAESSSGITTVSRFSIGVAMCRPASGCPKIWSTKGKYFFIAGMLCVLQPFTFVLSFGQDVCGQQLLRAKKILDLFGSEAMFLPMSGYLPYAPPWLEKHWADYLLNLPDDALLHAEQHGLAELLLPDEHAPTTLRETATTLSALEAQFPVLARPSAAASGYGMSKPKLQQVDCFLRATRHCLRQSTEIGRVVDVGCGLGALTRELAISLGVPCLGLDRDPEKVRSAERLAENVGSQVSFAVCDIQRPGALRDVLRPSDLVVGLHPCGSLGEDLIRAVATSEAALLMVSCCIMGRPWAPVPFPRPPCSQLGQELALSMPRSALKMANLWAPGAVPEEKIITRLSLRQLLAIKGWLNESFAPSCTSLTPSMRGVTRAHVKGGFGSIAARVLHLRELPPASEKELTEAQRWGTEVAPIYRRLELLTPLLGEASELAVNLDRARSLEEAQKPTTLARMFPKASSPRNLAIYAAGVLKKMCHHVPPG